eukprot:6079865-Prymnesium_polylepis.1
MAHCAGGLWDPKSRAARRQPQSAKHARAQKARARAPRYSPGRRRAAGRVIRGRQKNVAHLCAPAWYML